MKLRQVFVSLLMFGVAGLLLFMYLQAWTEEQNTGTVGLWVVDFLWWIFCLLVFDKVIASMA